MSVHNLTNLSTIILASESKYKKAVLEKLQIPFTCIAPRIDETALENEHPKDLVNRLAKIKARTIAESHPNCYIIAADQVACFNDQILGKPGNRENAFQQLQLFSGNRVDFITGLAVVSPQHGHPFQLTETFSVQFKTLSVSEINAYIEKEEPLDCAGSFKSEGLGILLFEKLIGRDPNSLIGLPLIGLRELFEQAGINLLTETARG